MSEELREISVLLPESLLEDINDWHYEYVILKKRWTEKGQIYYVAEKTEEPQTVLTQKTSEGKE